MSVVIVRYLSDNQQVWLLFFALAHGFNYARLVRVQGFRASGDLSGCRS